MPDNFTFLHRAQIISLAARHNVPTVYNDMTFARDGGLLGYGSDQVDIFRRSASYVDRILRGAKSADLPVQLPIKFEMGVKHRDRQGAQTHCAALYSASRRRGYRISGFLLHCMSPEVAQTRSANARCQRHDSRDGFSF
jgi:hypothetical protein